MASPASLPDQPVPPAADPVAIRACLGQVPLAEFDREWVLTLDAAKAARSLEPIHEMLAKWRHIAAAEQRDPGAYLRLLQRAAEIEQAGHNPRAGTIEDMRAMLRRRTGA
jgi:hypothetical protein